MNRNRDFDETVASWLDEGADRAPERYVWAALEDVERTAQRGAWQASLEEFFMHLKPAAPVLGVVAVVVLAIAAYQLTATPNLGDSPRTFAAADLPNVIVTSENAPEGTTIDLTTSGRTALMEPLRPGGRVIDTSGFVDALKTELSTPQGIYATWAAVFETEEDARQAFEFVANEHESADGWGLEGSSADPALGDESRVYSGPMYDFESAETIFWRENNLLLAAIGAVDWSPEYLRTIADGMAARTE